jgi:cytidine deaminase
MRAYRISAEDQLLINQALELARKRRSEQTSVAAVLKTKDRRVFQGVNIEVSGSAPSSFCAEYAAIGAMVTEGASEILTIVAVNGKKNLVLPPCGNCRQLLREFGNPYVILTLGGRHVKVRLAELYPVQVT